jgi:hypothetical protein
MCGWKEKDAQEKEDMRLQLGARAAAAGEGLRPVGESDVGLKTDGNGRDRPLPVFVTIFCHRERDSRERERDSRLYENDQIRTEIQRKRVGTGNLSCDQNVDMHSRTAAQMHCRCLLLQPNVTATQVG